jgi:hypothetical protein
LDASKYYIILPDSISHGKSPKPSDGLRTKFPSFNYDDMVDAQYRLVTEGLGIQHVRLLRRDQLDVAIRQGAQELAGLPIVSVGDPGATLVAAITGLTVDQVQRWRLIGLTMMPS